MLGTVCFCICTRKLTDLENELTGTRGDGWWGGRLGKIYQIDINKKRAGIITLIFDKILRHTHTKTTTTTKNSTSDTEGHYLKVKFIRKKNMTILTCLT